MWVHCNLFSRSLAHGQCLIYWSLVLEKGAAEKPLISLPKYTVPILPPFSSPRPRQVFIQTSGYLEFWFLPSKLNPLVSQYFILMGSKAFENGIQTFWAVSKGDDFLLNGINPTNPVSNLISTSDRGRKCCFLNEIEGAFYNKMCLLLIHSPEKGPEIVREGQFPRTPSL